MRGIWPRPRRGRTSRSPLELERSAGRAQARGGLAAAAAFLQRAVALTKDPARRADRALAAAQASLQAGAFDAALGLAATAEAGPLDEFQRARVDLLRAQVAFAAGRLERCSPAAAEGRDAARAVRPGPRARDLPDRLGRGGAGGGSSPRATSCVEICRAVRALPPPPGAPRPLRPAARRFRPADHRGTRRRDPDAAASRASGRRHSRGGRPAVGLDGRGRQRGRVGPRGLARELPRDRSRSSATPARSRRCRSTSRTWGWRSSWTGDFAGAASLVAEVDSVAAVTGSRFPPYTLLRLRGAAGQGRRGLRGDRERDRSSSAGRG